MVKIWRLGLTSFSTALKIQVALARRQLDAIAKGHDLKGDTLLLLEHKPVYTVGIRDQTPKEEIAKLKDLGAEFRKTNRGGLITFHGPGQLVAYPVLNLKHFQPSVKWYVHSLEQAAIQLSEELGLKASRSPHTGVWIGDNKIAAIGIHGSRYVTTHGISLNCDNDLSWFDHIVPCGIEGKGVTSFQKETGQDCGVEEMSHLFLKHFSNVFVCKMEPLDTHIQEEVLRTVYSSLMVNQAS